MNSSLIKLVKLGARGGADDGRGHKFRGDGWIQEEQAQAPVVALRKALTKDGCGDSTWSSWSMLRCTLS